MATVSVYFALCILALRHEIIVWFCPIDLIRILVLEVLWKEL